MGLYHKNGKPNICIIILIMILFSSLAADVKSKTGTILFSPQLGTTNMSLNSSGLGIGTLAPSANLNVQGNAIVTKNMTIGGSTPGSANLHVNGTWAYQPLTLTGSSNIQTIVGHTMVMANTSSDNVTIKLPTASLYPGQVIYCTKTSQYNSLSIKSDESIDGYDGLLLGSVGCAQNCFAREIGISLFSVLVMTQSYFL